MESKKPMRVVFSSSEMVPFSKTGGLADVAGSLPQALGELGDEIMRIGVFGSSYHLCLAGIWSCQAYILQHRLVE